MPKYLFEVKIYYTRRDTRLGISVPSHIEYTPLAANDQTARSKSIRMFQKWYQDEYSANVPAVKYCDIECLAEVDA